MKDDKYIYFFVGSYEEHSQCGGGGIYSLRLERNTMKCEVVSQCGSPRQAGYLLFNRGNSTLYSVDERKTDGRGPVNPPAAVFSFSVNEDFSLTEKNKFIVPGPRPTYLDYDESRGLLFCANHGDFQHVEKVIISDEGKPEIHFVYDDSTVSAIQTDENGALDSLHDIAVFEGHGKDPNFSKQNAGHAQASAHAHCVVVAPESDYMFICDKGTDKIYVYKYSSGFEKVSEYQFPEETGPRHLIYDKNLVYVTCEFASALALLNFDHVTGALTLSETISTITGNRQGPNEPAHLCKHPQLDVIYVNNRGEDSIVWFEKNAAGELSRRGGIPLSKSVHPGLAARSFCFSQDGSVFLLADRSADLLRVFTVNTETGDLHWQTNIDIPDPAFACFAE